MLKMDVIIVHQTNGEINNSFSRIPNSRFRNNFNATEKTKHLSLHLQSYIVLTEAKTIGQRPSLLLCYNISQTCLLLNFAMLIANDILCSENMWYFTLNSTCMCGVCITVWITKSFSKHFCCCWCSYSLFFWYSIIYIIF